MTEQLELKALVCCHFGMTRTAFMAWYQAVGLTKLNKMIILALF